MLLKMRKSLPSFISMTFTTSKAEPVGGASRFVTVIEQLIQQNPSLVIFCGDALSPSLSI